MISYSSLGECREASVTREVSRRFFASPPCRLTLPFVHSRPSHPREGLFNMHRTCWVYLGRMQCTLTMEQVKWSSFDQFWVVFHGELLGEDVISWPCSFRGQNNTFRDLRALGLWTLMIGVAMPKNVYNTCAFYIYLHSSFPILSHFQIFPNSNYHVLHFLQHISSNMHSIH